MNSDLSFENLLTELNKYQNIVTAVHISPDLDSVCSCLSLKRILKDKNITILSAESIPDYISKILDLSELTLTDPADYDFTGCEVYVSMDCDSPDRVTTKENFVLPKDLKVINIDHHHTNSNFGYFNFVDETASSTCSILYYLHKITENQIDLKTGELLITGMLADTGIFQYSNTSDKDFIMAAELSRMGINTTEIIMKTTNKEDYDFFKFKGVAFTNLTKEKNYIFTHISKNELLKANLNPMKKFPSVANEIRKIDGIDFAFTVREKEDNTYYISFRSHNLNYDVSKIADALENGGGHIHSAGAQISGCKNIKEALNIIRGTINKVASNSQ